MEVMFNGKKVWTEDLEQDKFDWEYIADENPDDVIARVFADQYAKLVEDLTDAVNDDFERVCQNTYHNARISFNMPLFEKAKKKAIETSGLTEEKIDKLIDNRWDNWHESACEVLHDRLTEELAEKFKGTYKIYVTGRGNATWYIDELSDYFGNYTNDPWHEAPDYGLEIIAVQGYLNDLIKKYTTDGYDYMMTSELEWTIEREVEEMVQAS